MPPALQREIISYSYNVMNEIESDIYTFVKIENSNSNKKLLKKFLTRNNVYTSVICSHSYKYLPELKDAAQNMILFAPLTLQHDFASYNTFLNKLNQDEFIIYGAHTQNIPLIVELDTFEIEKDENEEPDDILQQDLPEIKSEVKQEAASPNENIIQEEQVSPVMPEVEYPDITIDEIPVKKDNSTDDTELVSIDENIEIVNNNEIPPVQNILEEEANVEHVIEEQLPEENIEESQSDSKLPETENIQPEQQISIEEPEIDYSVEDIDIEENFGEPLIIENNDELAEQVARDVDKAF